MAGTKDHRFYFRLTETDRTMLDDLAEAMGVAPSGVIRVLLREKHRSIYGMQVAGEPKPKPKPRRRRKR
jgi:hypothetical protein